jgi:hypothetical protein
MGHLLTKESASHVMHHVQHVLIVQIVNAQLVQRTSYCLEHYAPMYVLLEPTRILKLRHVIHVCHHALFVLVLLNVPNVLLILSSKMLLV